MTPIITPSRLADLQDDSRDISGCEMEALADWLKAQPRDYTKLIDGLNNSNSAAIDVAVSIYAAHMRPSLDMEIIT